MQHFELTNSVVAYSASKNSNFLSQCQGLADLAQESQCAGVKSFRASQHPCIRLYRRILGKLLGARRKILHLTQFKLTFGK